MGGLLRKLTIWICIPISRLIVSLYSIFYNIANTRFLEDDTIQQLSANIYVLVSVVMLFAFSVTILSAIVNPDLLNDSKKGVAAAFKRAIIGLALMVIVPFAFDEIYAVQKNIMDNSLIEKIIVGADFRCDKDEDGNCKVGGNGGQVIAGNLISSVLYPVEDNVQISENISDKYEKMITTDIRYIGAVSKHINVTTEGDNAYHSDFDDDDYAFNWDGLVAIIAGFATCYILLLFAIDMAIRVFKLAFLELTAPISIVAYMASGDKTLKSWAGQVLKTFLDVFTRIAAIAFYLFLIKNLSTYMAKFEGAEWSFTLKVLLIVGMLIFVKQIPEFINNTFGTKFDFKGGTIDSRLGEMAIVGKQAQTAWRAVKQAAKLGAGAVGLGLASVANPAAALGLGLAHHGWNKGFKKLGARAGKETATGKFLTSAGKTAGAYLKGKGLTSGLADAKKAYSESDFGLERIANKNYKEAVKSNEEFNKKMGNDEDGMITDVNLAKTNFNNNSKKDLGTVRGKAVDALLDANIQKAKVEKITSDKDAIVSNLDTLMANAKTVEAQNAISDLKNNLLTSKYSINQFRENLNNLIDQGIINGTDGGTISSKLDSITNKIASDKTISDKLINSDGKLNFGGSGLGTLTTIVNTKASNAKTTYDNLYKGSSENVKQEMDKYSAQSEQIVTESVKQAQGKVKIENKDNIHYQSPKNVTSANSSTQNSSSSSSTSNSNSTNTQNNTTQNTQSDDTDDALDAMMNAQIEVNEERLNNAWKNQSTDDTYRRGTFEPQKNDNNSNDSYDDMFADQYDNDDSNPFAGTDDDKE